MQNATSIQSPTKSNLVTTFKYFSDDFNFDLCHDFSFWRTETGRCIPKKMYNEQTDEYYAFSPLCNRTDFDCTDGWWTDYCPNRGEICVEEHHFFCNDSKTCIPNGNNLSYIHTDQITRGIFQF